MLFSIFSKAKMPYNINFWQLNECLETYNTKSNTWNDIPDPAFPSIYQKLTLQSQNQEDYRVFFVNH